MSETDRTDLPAAPIRLPVPRVAPDLDPETDAAVEAAMSRHPAGRRQRRPRGPVGDLHPTASAS